MYTNVLVEHMVRERQREIEQYIEEQSLIKLARAGRESIPLASIVRRAANSLAAFFTHQNRQVAKEDCV